MTRVAKLSDTSRTRPLAATRSPVDGLGEAPRALLSARVASTATRTKSQNERAAEGWTSRATRGRREGSVMICYIPRCCLAGVTAISAVRAISTSNSPSAKIMTMGRLRQ